MSKAKTKEHKPTGDFTIKGFNDKPKPCPEAHCSGKVRPTWNANVGECDSCGGRYAWGGMARNG